MSRFIPRLIRNASSAVNVRNASLDARPVYNAKQTGSPALDAALQADLADAIAIQPAPTLRGILERNVAAMERALDIARQHAAGLDAELARVTEELRQTRVSVEAFELAMERMQR